jgi:hypothetical protein
LGFIFPLLILCLPRLCGAGDILRTVLATLLVNDRLNGATHDRRNGAILK